MVVVILLQRYTSETCFCFLFCSRVAQNRSLSFRRRSFKSGHARKTTRPCFVGADVLISPDFATGDSWRGLGANFDVDEELVASLKMASASKTTFPFPADEKLGANGLVRKIESFELLYYYDGRGDVDAKCVVQFWRPGFSPDGKRCVIRFHYGPTDHGAEGTYVLKLARGEWEIVNSKISIGI